MESLKSLIPFKKHINTEETKEIDWYQQLDMLEKGLASNFNSSLFM